MVVVMSGSPNAAAYPAPSAEVWAKRAQQEQAQAGQQKKGYNELSSTVKTRKQRELEAKKEAKRLADEKFKAEQARRQAKLDAEKKYAQDVRSSSLQTIQSEAKKAARDASLLEQSRFQLGKLRVQEQKSGGLYEDQVEKILDAGDVEFQAQVAKAALEQRRLEEQNEEKRQQVLKQEREAKATSKEMETSKLKSREARRQTDENYRIKKEMALETQRQKDKEAAKAAELKARRQKERKKNDEYDAWLGQGDVLRDEQELMNERREGSSMSKGAKFSGIPDTKVDGKGNQ